MIPVGQAYRPVGSYNLRSILSTLILGTTAAVIAALVVWAWESSPIPTLIILTPILQGGLIGLVLAFAIGRLRLRNVWMLTVMGFACGLASVALVHFSHHLSFLELYASNLKEEVAKDPQLTPEDRTEILAMIDKEPNKVIDAALVAKTGYPGPIGSLLLRNEIGVQIKSATLSGWGLWGLWGVEALIVAGVATLMASSRAAQPFCDDCHEWCEAKAGGGVLPGPAVEPLANSVATDDLAAFLTLRENPPESTGTNYAGTTLHVCPSCSQTFADVWLRTDKVKGNKTETSTKLLLKQVRVSPEMLNLLRNQPNAMETDEGEEPLAETVTEPIPRGDSAHPPEA